MKTITTLTLLALGLNSLFAPTLAGGGKEAVDFSTARSASEKSYRYVALYHHYAPDGTLTGTESTDMRCKISVDSDGGQQLICLGFDLQDNEGTVRSIPKLKGWTNEIDHSADEVLGIPHADFVNLVDADDAPLDPNLGYRVYNTFVDFYAFTNVFGESRPGDDSKDISDLTAIGDVIEHYSAYSEPPVNLGDGVKEGSHFRNGRATLEWLGMSRIGSQDCALVRFDSGESGFVMYMEPMPDMDMTVKGGSHYWGDLFINVDDYWVEKVTVKELVLSKMTFGEHPPMSAVIKRLGTITRTD